MIFYGVTKYAIVTAVAHSAKKSNIGHNGMDYSLNYVPDQATDIKKHLNHFFHCRSLKD